MARMRAQGNPGYTKYDAEKAWNREFGRVAELQQQRAAIIARQGAQTEGQTEEQQYERMQWQSGLDLRKYLAEHGGITRAEARAREAEQMRARHEQEMGGPEGSPTRLKEGTEEYKQALGDSGGRAQATRREAGARSRRRADAGVDHPRGRQPAPVLSTRRRTHAGRTCRQDGRPRRRRSEEGRHRGALPSGGRAAGAAAPGDDEGRGGRCDDRPRVAPRNARWNASPRGTRRSWRSSRTTP